MKKTKELKNIAIKNDTTLALPKLSLNNFDEYFQRVLVNLPRNLDEATPAQLDIIIKYATFQKLAKQASDKINAVAIDYDTERKTFIERSSKSKSAQTQRAYNNALLKLEKYATDKNIDILTMTPLEADDFINDLKQVYSSATVRLTVATASTFYTFLQRRHNTIGNPFRGTKERPRKEPSQNREYCFPCTDEAQKIIDNTDDMELKVILIFALKLGLRAGAFQTLTITGNRFYCKTKGKDFRGELPAECIKALATIPNGKNKQPFKDWTAKQVENATYYLIKKLHAMGTVAHRYSIHDFRHTFAVNFYNDTKDIHATQKALNHSSILTTELYLKQLNVID